MATNYLQELKQKGFSGSPGYQFALDQGQQAIRRSMPGMRGSGNILAALTQHAVGTAQQDYGNEFDRALRADAMTGEQDISRGRLNLDSDLGHGQLDLGRGRLALDDRLGSGRLDVDRGDLAMRRTANDRDFALGSFRATTDRDLGFRGLDDQRERGWWDYDLGKGRLGLDTARAENDYNLGRDANARGWYDSRTQRGAARSTDWGRRQQYRDPGAY